MKTGPGFRGYLSSSLFSSYYCQFFLHQDIISPTQETSPGTLLGKWYALEACSCPLCVFPQMRVGALTIRHRCEFKHCMQRTLEIWQLIWKGGESSHQRQGIGGGYHLLRLLLPYPLPYGKLHQGHTPPHSATGTTENRVGSEEECRKVASISERKESLGECGNTVSSSGETGWSSGMWPISSLTGQT